MCAVIPEVQEAENAEEPDARYPVSNRPIVEIPLCAPVEVELGEAVDPHQYGKAKEGPQIHCCDVDQLCLCLIPVELPGVEVRLFHNGCYHGCCE